MLFPDSCGGSREDQPPPPYLSEAQFSHRDAWKWNRQPIEPDSPDIEASQQHTSKIEEAKANPKTSFQRPTSQSRQPFKNSVLHDPLCPDSQIVLENFFGLRADPRDQVTGASLEEIKRYIRDRPGDGDDPLSDCIRLRNKIVARNSSWSKQEQRYLTPAQLCGLRLEAGSDTEINQAFGRIWLFCEETKLHADNWELQLRWFTRFKTPNLKQCQSTLCIWKVLRDMLGLRTGTPRPNFPKTQSGLDPVIEWVMRQGLKEIDSTLNTRDPHLYATQMYTGARNKSEMPFMYLEAACEAWKWDLEGTKSRYPLRP